MAQKFRKKMQRRINRLMRECNKNIERDSLWKGRFCVRQIYSQYWWYEDGSGAVLCSIVDFFDKKTKQHMNKVLRMSAPNYNDNNVEIWDRYIGYDLFRYMNDFIVERVKVWNEVPSPREDKTDYTNIPYECPSRH